MDNEHIRTMILLKFGTMEKAEEAYDYGTTSKWTNDERRFMFRHLVDKAMNQIESVKTK